MKSQTMTVLECVRSGPVRGMTVKDVSAATGLAESVCSTYLCWLVRHGRLETAGSVQYPSLNKCPDAWGRKPTGKRRGRPSKLYRVLKKSNARSTHKS